MIQMASKHDRPICIVAPVQTGIYVWNSCSRVKSEPCKGVKKEGLRPPFMFIAEQLLQQWHDHQCNDVNNLD